MLPPFEFDGANRAIEYGVNCGRDFMRDTSRDDYAKHMSPNTKWTREREKKLGTWPNGSSQENQD